MSLTTQEARREGHGAPCGLMERALGDRETGGGLDGKKGGRALLILLGLILLYFAFLGSLPLLEPDEGRYTEIPREMIARGDYVLPHLNGVLYFEKPPLYYWLNVLSIKVFGLNPFASRFWSAALGLAGVLVTACLARRVAGTKTARLALLVLATSPLYLAISRIAIIDMTLTFFFTVTLACFFLAQSAKRGTLEARLLWYGTFVGAALAVLAKGLIGIVLPGAIIGLYILLAGEWAVLLSVPWVTGILLFLAVAVPWHWLAAARNGDFLWFYFVREHFLRYLTPIADRREPFWFFGPVLVWGLLPWTAFLPGAFVQFWKTGRAGRWPILKPGLEAYLWIWAAVIFLFFSASQSKLIPYIVPAMAPLAILAAMELDRLLSGAGLDRRWTAALATVCLTFTGLCGLVFVAGGAGLVKAYGPSGLLHPVLIAVGLLTVLLSTLALVWSLRGRWPRAIAAMALAACALFWCVWAAAPQIQKARSMRSIASFLETNARPGDVVIAYRFYPQTLPVYLARPIAVAAFTGEQTFGVSKLDEAVRRDRFPDAKEFRALWDSPVRVFCVVDKDSLESLASEHVAPIYPIVEEPQVELITNQPWDSGAGR